MASIETVEEAAANDLSQRNRGTMTHTEHSHQSTLLSQTEEAVNAVTHGIGMLLSIVGATYLIYRACLHSSGVQIAACSAYGSTLVAVYTASTLSHACSQSWLQLFRRLDQGFIYLLIVGTYTPISVTFLRGAWWWAFLALMWTVAALGFVIKQLAPERLSSVAISSYMILGWLPIVACPTLVRVVPPFALWWILIGGLCYTVGTVFLIFDRHVRHFHAIWHLLVIAGSCFHFFAILFVACAAE